MIGDYQMGFENDWVMAALAPMHVPRPGVIAFSCAGIMGWPLAPFHHGRADGVCCKPLMALLRGAMWVAMLTHETRQ
jgi:hypothetical protein